MGFSCGSHTPQPDQRRCCTVCRKTAGGGGCAVDVMAEAASMWIGDPDGARRVYRAGRSFCGRCASALWLWDPRWPELIHSIASAIHTGLPVPPEGTHILSASKASAVVPRRGPVDGRFDGNPAQSIEDRRGARGPWVE